MAIFAKLACLTLLAMIGHVEAATVVDVLVSDPEERFTVLYTALEQQGLLPTLSGEGPFTVFAPTNAAFEALGEALGLSSADQLLARDGLGDILQYHVLSGEVHSAQLTNGQRAPTLQGSDITVSVEGSTVMIDDGLVTTADANADNGVIHIINKVLVPRVTVVDVLFSDAEERFTVLYTALAQTGLLPTLSGGESFTVFAPTNSAFEALGEALGLSSADQLLARDDLGDILQYHVLSGEVHSAQLTNGQRAATLQGSDITVSIDGSTVMINDATVIAADVNHDTLDKGVVHIIDKVLMPSGSDSGDTTSSSTGSDSGDTTSSTGVDVSGARAPSALVGLMLASVSALVA